LDIILKVGNESYIAMKKLIQVAFSVAEGVSCEVKILPDRQKCFLREKRFDNAMAGQAILCCGDCHFFLKINV